MKFSFFKSFGFKVNLCFAKMQKIHVTVLTCTCRNGSPALVKETRKTGIGGQAYKGDGEGWFGQRWGDARGHGRQKAGLGVA